MLHPCRVYALQGFFAGIKVKIMMKLMIGLQARMGSTRLGNKMLRPIGRNPLFHVMAKKCMDLKFMFQGDVDVSVGLCTTRKKEDDVLVDWANYFEFDEIVRGKPLELIDQYLDLCDDGYDYCLRICGDQPLLNLSMSGDLLSLMKKKMGWDYYSFCTAEGIPVMQTKIGVGAEIFSVYKLKQKAINLSGKEYKEYQEHVTPIFYKKGSLDNVCFLKLPSIMSKVQTAIDQRSDMKKVNKLIKQINISNFKIEGDQTKSWVSELSKIVKYFSGEEEKKYIYDGKTYEWSEEWEKNQYI